MRSIISDDRGVSESLGYIIIFGVIVACIALVLVAGSQIITDSERQSSYLGMKQSFNVLCSDFRKVALESAPVLTTKVNVGSGSLSLENGSKSGRKIIVYSAPTKFEDPVSISNSAKYYELPLGAITYHPGIYGQKVSIEDGAEVEIYGANSRQSGMISEPRIFYSVKTNTLLIDIINLQCDNASVAGGVSRVESRYDTFSIKTITPSPGDYVMIWVNTPYVGAWNNYFEGFIDSYERWENGVLKEPYIATEIDSSSGESSKMAVWKSDTPFQKIEKVVIVTYTVTVTIR